MAVLPADLLSPKGRLDRGVLWPGVSERRVVDYLTAYLLQAATEAVDITDPAENDRARIAWAEYRAFDEVYQRLVVQPATVEDRDEGSQQRLIAQIELMKERRDEARAVFEAILQAATQDPEEDSYTVLKSLRD